MKTCPECRSALIEKRGDYIAPTIVIPNASWAECPACGYEAIPKALQKAIKRTRQEKST